MRFVATDFSTKLAPAPASDSTLSPLQFAPAEGLPPLPELPGVVDLQVADADDDGTLDLVLLTPTTLRVISPRDGNWITLFEHTGAGPWRRVLVADLDRDENKNARKEPVAGGATPPTDPRTCDTADVDFLLWGAGGLVVLRNELQDPPPARQVLVVAQSDEFNAQRDPRDVCLVDIDHDGDLDLVVALDKTVLFWRNRGNQTFEEVTDRSQIPAGSFSIASLTAGPWNHDCFIDVVATNDDGNLGVFENLGHSAFRWVLLADAAQAAPAGDRVLLFDADGNAFDGGKTYRLHLPPNVPVKDFWSVILYSNQTRSMIQTDQRFPSVSSLTKGLLVNADGSVDVWFGPKAPQGKEKNWVQTMPGKGWNTILRLYGPLEPWFDKSWRPGEIELVR